MQYKVIRDTIYEKQSHMTLVFLGWGFDDNALSDCTTPTTCVALWDYSDLTLPDEVVELAHQASHVNVIAWSMGVWAAQKTFNRYPDLKWMMRTAFCGAPVPYGDELGMSEAAVKLTAKNWNEENREKFYAKVFDSQDNKTYGKYKSKRSIEDQRNELLAIIAQFEADGKDVEYNRNWTNVTVGLKERVYKLQGLTSCWRRFGRSNCCHNVFLTHFPFYNYSNLREFAL